LGQAFVADHDIRPYRGEQRLARHHLAAMRQQFVQHREGLGPQDDLAVIRATQGAAGGVEREPPETPFRRRASRTVHAATSVRHR
jgi:hypothetical protein